MNFAVWYWNTFLNKCGYVIHYFNAYFSLCACFAEDYLLFIFIFILDYRNDVRQKVNLSDFFEFKMGCKAKEKTHNIDKTCGPGTVNEHTV